MIVKIPFLERFREPMLNNAKTQTARTKRYGKEGDTFEVFGVTFQINSVFKMRLREIANHWREEGCDSKQDFQSVWMDLHPRRDVILIEEFWVHVFHKIEAKKHDNSRKK